MLRLLVACSCDDNEKKHGSTGPEPPVITVPDDGAVTSSDRQEVSGFAEEDARVEVFDGDESLGTVDTPGGYWETMATDLSEGEHVFTATATKNGKTSAASEAVTLIVDMTSPEEPIIESPEDGDALNDSVVEFSGNAEPGTEIELIEDGDVVGSSTANEDGDWSIVVELDDGDHDIFATSADSAGNSSESDPVTVTVDTEAPDAPTIDNPTEDEIVATSSLLVEGEGEEDAEIELFLDGDSVATTNVDSSGSWSVTLDDLEDGEHELEAIATDAAGNESDASETVVFAVDSSLPTGPVILSPENGALLNDDTPTITGTAEEGAEVSVYANDELLGTVTAGSSGYWSFTSPPLPDGNYFLEAAAVDDAGNRAVSEAVSIGIDTVAPETPVIVSPTDGTIFVDDSTPDVSGTGVPSTIEVYDGTAVVGRTTAGASTWELTSRGLTDGEHTLTARAIDDAGNESDLSNAVTITIDTRAPTVDAGVDAVKNATFTQDAAATDANALTYQWSQESGPGTLSFGSATSEDTTITTDTDGTYTIRLTVTDIAGHTSYDEATVVWDTTPPVIVAVLPDRDADNVDVDSDVHVRFSEAMDPATLDGIMLDSGAVAGSTSAPTPTVFVFTPGSSLSPDTTYTASVAASVTDLAGNPVAETSWDFTTALAGLPEVEPFYVGRWNDYVEDDGSDVFAASGTPCDGSETGGYSACIHAGEMLVVDTGDTSCGNKAATDELGAFDWVCEDGSGSALMVSTGLSDGARLSDLIDFSALSWKPNSVTVTGTGGDAPFTTAAGAWWDNPVLQVGGGREDLDTEGGIYVVAEDLAAELDVTADKVALVVQPGYTLTNSGSEGSALLTSLSHPFLWFEGEFDANGGGTGMYLYESTFSVVRGLEIFNTSIGDFYTESCLRLQSSDNNSVTDVFAHDSTACIYIVDGADSNEISGVTSEDCGVGMYLATSSDNTVSDVLTNSDYGVYLNLSSDNVLNNVTTTDGYEGVFVSGGSGNELYNVVSERNSNNGIRLEATTNSSVSNVHTAENGYYGIQIYSSDGSRLSNLSSMNNQEVGIYLYGESTRMDGVTAFGNGNVGLVVAGQLNSVSNATLAHNGAVGFYCYGCYNGVFSGITAANNGDNGIQLIEAAASALLGLTATNNGANGVSIEAYYSYYDDDSTSFNMLSDVVSAHNTDYGISIEQASDYYLTGALKVGDNGAGDCYVDAESVSGDLADDTAADDATHEGVCNTTTAAISDFDLSTGVSLAASFVGKVGNGGLVDSTDDAENPDDNSPAGLADYASVTDFLSFENRYRGWGRDGSAFPNGDHQGRWTTGTGRIWDFSAALGDAGDGGGPVLLDVRSVPDGDAVNTMQWYLDSPPSSQADCDVVFGDSTFGASMCTTTFLKNAVEIAGDGVGNDNLLCESGETCLYTPNVGSYQGHGSLQSAGFVAGTVSGVTLEQYSANGY